MKSLEASPRGLHAKAGAVLVSVPRQYMICRDFATPTMVTAFSEWARKNMKGG